MKVRSIVFAALLAFAASSVSAVADEPTPTPDPVARTLAGAATLERDGRCGEAAKLVKATAAADATAGTAVQAVLALEKCANLPRTEGWTEYVDYVMTAAAACAVVAGRLSGPGKGAQIAYQRAVTDARLVHGFNASLSSRNVVIEEDRHGPTSSREAPSMATGPNSGPVRYTQSAESVASAPVPTEYGALATQIASIANTALAAASKQ